MGTLLIFGGTTEGRLAAAVCDEAGKHYWYSTKSDSQQIDLVHGIRISGGMDGDAMRAFCAEHDVRAIIDAAHPFATVLHQTIASVGVPVIRLQRAFAPETDGVTYCHSYEEAVRLMTDAGVCRLLALSGANTISHLKPFWQSHHAVFRILNRDESRTIAYSQGLTDAHLIYYNRDYELPSVDDERAMMLAQQCDAIITKDSGQNGGFAAKVEAAKSLGIKVFVIMPPPLPRDFIIVTGKHGLRRAIEQHVPGFFELRTGFTTGACATAATKAALTAWLTGETAEDAHFELPDGEVVSIPIDSVTIRSDYAEACVIKDAGDDPDVTNGCHVRALVKPNDVGEIRFFGGTGVGTVTLPGLGIDVGCPAINATPRSMMTHAIRQLDSVGGYDVTISVDEGEALAQRTFNPRVGVVGGISIIGTSGIVRPLSNEAFVQSIRREMQVARAIGHTEIGLVAGMKSEQQLQAERPDLRCVHYGNFIGEALQAARDLGFESVTLAIMIGKAVKLAEGHLDTHSHKVTMNHDFLSTLAPDYAAKIRATTMARELWDFMPPPFFERITVLCYEHCRTVFPDGDITIRLIQH